MWKRTEEEPGFISSARPAPAGEQQEPSFVGRTMVLRGELRGEEDLCIEGRVEGTIYSESHCVTVGRYGSVVGDIYAKEIHIRGELQGDMRGSAQVVVHQTGSVRGNITAPQVCLENGAKLKGTIDMDPQPQAEMVQSAIKGADGAKHELSKLQKMGKAPEKSDDKTKEQKDNLNAVQ